MGRITPGQNPSRETRHAKLYVRGDEEVRLVGPDGVPVVPGHDAHSGAGAARHLLEGFKDLGLGRTP